MSYETSIMLVIAIYVVLNNMSNMSNVNSVKDNLIEWFVNPVRNEKYLNQIPKRTPKQFHIGRQVKLSYRPLINGNIYIYLSSNL